MALLAKDVPRGEAHEQIRILSLEAAKVVKEEGKDNDLMDRIRRNKFFEPIIPQLDRLLDPRSYIGRSSQQVSRFTGPGGEVQRALGKYAEVLKHRGTTSLNV